MCAYTMSSSCSVSAITLPLGDTRFSLHRVKQSQSEDLHRIDDHRVSPLVWHVSVRSLGSRMYSSYSMVVLGEVPCRTAH